MPRFVLRTAIMCLLLAAGTVSALLAAGPGRSRAATVPLTPTTPIPTTPPPTAGTTTSPAPTVLVFDGHGYGHGLGLGQWGAYGYALHGWAYDRILAHFYSGTALGSSPVSKVRVLVASGKRVTLGATAAWTVAGAGGERAAPAVGMPLTLRPALALDGAPLAGPLTITSSRPLLVNGQAFRGRLTVLSDGKTLQVVDTVGLEAYVKGVVAAEMPPKWPLAALEAQAVAARSYALANLRKGGSFDLFADGRSQIYGGVALETPSTNAAVDATRGRVVVWRGKVADTLFSSSSGGRTASAQASLGQDIPYLAAVADPYDRLSPYHDWGPLVVGGTDAAKPLKLAGRVQDVQVTNGADGRVASLTAGDALASQVTVTGEEARLALRLPSTWFTPSVLSLLPSSKALAFGGAISLTGFLHAGIGEPAAGVSLEAKSLGTGWLPAGSLTLDSTGAFSASVSPMLSTQYRLAWGDVRAGLAKIAVSPVVTATVGVGAITGGVQPVLVGAAVELQRSDGAAWTTVSATTTDAAGAWSFAGTPAPGTYRVRCAPGHGLAPGLSPPLEVQ